MFKFTVAASLLVVATSASAVPISTVGTIDTLIGHTTLKNSGSATEESWVESLLGTDITYSQLSGSSGSAWQAVTGGSAGDYAFDFGADSNALYYLVKVGGGGGTNTIDTHFLLGNNDSLQWGYVNLSMFGSGVSLTNIGVISHVGTTSVPEPATLTLFGAGLAVAGLMRRRRSVVAQRG